MRRRRRSIRISEAGEVIPWAQVAGLRDRLIHAYFTVDPRLVWHVVQNELASLDDAVTDLLGALTDSDTPLS